MATQLPASVQQVAYPDGSKAMVKPCSDQYHYNSVPWDELPIGFLPCPHQHFKMENVDRNKISRDDHIALLATPKGYRWLGMADMEKPKPYSLARSKRRRPRQDAKLFDKSENRYIHEFLADVWSIMSPQMIDELKKILVDEFGMTIFEAENFIIEQSESAEKSKKKGCIVDLEIRSHWLKQFRRVIAAKLTDYIASRMCARRTKRTLLISTQILSLFCDLTGEQCTLNNPQNQVQRLQVFVADRIAAWLSQAVAEADKELCDEMKKEEGADGTVVRPDKSIPGLKPKPKPKPKPEEKPPDEPKEQEEAKPPSKPPSGPSSKPPSKPSSKPPSGPSSKPTSGPSSKPTSGPSSKPTSGPSSKPTSGPSSKPSSKPASKPPSKPASKPPSETASKPPSKPSTETASPAPESQPDTVPEAVAEEESVPESEPPSSTEPIAEVESEAEHEDVIEEEPKVVVESEVEVVPESEPEETEGEKEEEPTAVVEEIIGDTEPKVSPRQSIVSDIIKDQLLGEVEKLTPEAGEAIVTAADKTATWVDKTVVEAEPPAPKPIKDVTFHIRRGDKDCYYDVKQIDQKAICEKTTLGRSGKSLPLAEKDICARPATAEPMKMCRTDLKEWTDWNTTAASFVGRWASWIDKTCKEAEEKAKNRQKGDKTWEADWSKWKQQTGSSALEWRRNSKYLNKTESIWKDKLEKMKKK